MFCKMTSFVGSSLRHPVPAASPECHPNIFFQALGLPALLYRVVQQVDGTTTSVVWDGLDLVEYMLYRAFAEAYRVQSFMNRAASDPSLVDLSLNFHRKGNEGKHPYAKFEFEVGSQKVLCRGWNGEADFSAAKGEESLRAADGWNLIEAEGKIVGASRWGDDRIFRIGCRVCSKGRYYHGPSGLWGVVAEIDEPGKGGRTSDILSVRWDTTKDCSSMKAKDLDFLVWKI